MQRTQTRLSRVRSGRRTRAFTLIELLTVIFIISLLIAILIPAVNGARNQAKQATTGSAIKALKVGLETFKNDHERDFRQTNGYPPSFAHPRIGRTGVGYNFQPHLGQFPFLDPESSGSPPVTYGAQWLPAMLIGNDALGYVPRSAVPKAIRIEPWKWYTPDPLQNDGDPIPRSPLYVDSTSLRLIPTKDLPGFRNEAVFPDSQWDVTKRMPVIADAFDQPILYYAANAFGTNRNMVEPIRTANNQYADGQPRYFHGDNAGFTGTGDQDGEEGWDFGGGKHMIAEPGDEPALVGQDTKTFANFIRDQAAARAQADNPNPDDAPHRPLNPDSYLLISAGIDGVYGTPDDITNFPRTGD